MAEEKLREALTRIDAASKEHRAAGCSDPKALLEIEGIVRAALSEDAGQGHYAKVEKAARDSRYSNEFIGNLFRAALAAPPDQGEREGEA